MDNFSRLLAIQRRDQEINAALNIELIEDEICRRNRIRAYKGIPFDRDDLLPDPDKTAAQIADRIADDFDFKYRIGKYSASKMTAAEYQREQMRRERAAPTPTLSNTEKKPDKDSPEAIERDLFASWDDDSADQATPDELDQQYKEMQAEYKELTGEEI